jgi:anti-sigma B factor antagonist
MVISSRTPEGEHGRCPVCGTTLKVEPSVPAGDAPCHDCGHLIWFAAAESDGDIVVRFTTQTVEAETIERLMGSLEDRSVRRIIFDFAGVRYCDSAALGAMIHLKRRIHGRGSGLVLRNLRPDMREVFLITRLDQVFEIEA